MHAVADELRRLPKESPVRDRHPCLDRSSHTRCKRDRDLFHRRITSRTCRQKPRPPMGDCGHRRRLGNVDLRLRPLADRADLGLCRHPGTQGGGAAVIIAILNVYLVLLVILVKMMIVPFSLFWKISPLIVLLLLMFGLFIPMGWGAPLFKIDPTPLSVPTRCACRAVEVRRTQALADDPAVVEDERAGGGGQAKSPGRRREVEPR